VYVSTPHTQTTRAFPGEFQKFRVTGNVSLNHNATTLQNAHYSPQKKQKEGDKKKKVGNMDCR
jgi:hypothetical protein